MMIPADKIVERARKIVRLRKPEIVADNVNDMFIVAAICKRMSDRWYARGHTIIEWEYRS